MFTDKVYEDLDELSQLVEPFNCELNDELAIIPDCIEITVDDIMHQLGDLGRWSTFSVERFMIIKIREYKGSDSVLADIWGAIDKFFKLKVEGEDVRSFTIDIEKNTMSHKLVIVKDKLCYEEKELEKMSRNRFHRQVRDLLWQASKVNKSRLNEIAELFNAEKSRQSRNWDKKVSLLCDHIKSMMEDRDLNIRDLGLAERFGRWVGLYVRDGSLPALTNITKLKIMTHSGKPIYSIEEVDV